jgi:hypothetical protein
MKALKQSGELLLTSAAHQSSYIENVLRHRMTAELCSELWKRDCRAALHIFNSEVDNSGFDMVLRLQSAIRYVQIKQAHAGKVPPHCSTRVSFSQMAGSCIVLISYAIEDLTISSYRFFGKKPHEPMQEIEAFKPSISPGRRNAKGERHIRSHYRDVRVSQFTLAPNAEQLFDLLFPSGIDPIMLGEDDPLLALRGTRPIDQSGDELLKSLRNNWGHDEFN